MKRLRKITKWAVLATAILLVLTLAVIVSLPGLSNLDIVRTELLKQLSAAIGIDLHYEQVEVHLLPRPELVLQAAAFSAGPDMQGQAGQIHVYPSIPSLLQGRIHLESIRLQDPVLRINLPYPLRGEAFDPFAAIEAAKPSIASFLSKSPIGPTGLFVQFSNGRLVMPNGSTTPFDVSAIQATLQCFSQSFWINARGKSNLSQAISLKGRLNAHSWNASGELRIKQFQPKPVADYLFPGKVISLARAVSDIHLQGRLEPTGSLVLRVEAQQPEVSLAKHDHLTHLKGQQLRATLEMDPDHMSVSLGALQMDQPRMNVSGNFFYSRKVPEIRIELTGLDVDVGAFRRSAQNLVGHMLWSQKLFAVLQGGRVPVVSFSVVVDSLRAFEKVENYVIKGSIGSGDITIPGLELDLTDVRGDVVISKGILSGANLQARYEKSTGADGTLEMGLTRADPRFHLDIDVNAAVSQVPAALQKLMPGTYIAEKSKLFHKPRGRARGKLILGDDLNDVKPQIAVSSFNLYTVYKAIPYPLIIQGGSMSIGDSQWTGDKIRAQIGRTTFSKLSFTLDHRSEPHIRLTARESEVDLAEAHGWLPLNGSGHAKANSIRILKGNAYLGGLTIEGPFFDPGSWKSRLSGTVSDILVQKPGFPGPVQVARGDLTFVGHGSEKSVLSIVSADLQWQSSHIQTTGEVVYSRKALAVDLKVFADRLTYEQITRASRGRTSFYPKPSTLTRPGIPLTGRIKLFADAFTLAGYTWRPVTADLTLNANGIQVNIQRAQFCEMNIPGRLDLTGGHLKLSFSMLEEQQDLSTALQCLNRENEWLSGRYSINGSITADAPASELPAALKGNLRVLAREGRIKRYGVVAKITALLNVTEIFRGRLPDVARDGFAYEKIKLNIDISGGKLLIQESTIKGNSMTIVGSGELDLINGTVDMTVLFAPFKTIDTIIKNVPIINSIMGGKLVSIPFKVEGPIDSYEVVPMSPTAVNSGVFGLMKKTLRLPLTIWQPMREGEYTFDEEKLQKYRGNKNAGER